MDQIAFHMGRLHEKVMTCRAQNSKAYDWIRDRANDCYDDFVEIKIPKRLLKNTFYGKEDVLYAIIFDIVEKPDFPFKFYTVKRYPFCFYVKLKLMKGLSSGGDQNEIK
jgi:hypothetical protein